MNKHFLEPAAQGFANATSTPPFLYELGPEEAQKVLDEVQAAPIEKPNVDDKWITVPAEVGDVQVRIVKPFGATGVLPTVLYVHGGGWVLGNSGTHDRLIRELAVGVHAAVVFVEYDRAPEAHYPVAIEQAYATAQWITQHGLDEGLDATHLAVAGDSVGGNMTAALAILASRWASASAVSDVMNQFDVYKNLNIYPFVDVMKQLDVYKNLNINPLVDVMKQLDVYKNLNIYPLVDVMKQLDVYKNLNIYPLADVMKQLDVYKNLNINPLADVMKQLDRLGHLEAHQPPEAETDGHNPNHSGSDDPPRSEDDMSDEPVEEEPSDGDGDAGSKG